MDITTAHLTEGNASSGNSVNTASITPTGNRLILASVFSARGSGGSVNTPTLSGNGITWVQVETVQANSNNWRLTVFRGMVTSPTTGVVTIDFAGQNQDDGIFWFIDEFAGVNTTGTNGSAAVVQSDSGVATGTNTGLTITLSAFASTKNATFGVVATQGGALTEGSGFTVIGLTSTTSANGQDQFKNSNDTSVDWSWGSIGVDSPGIAIEIAAKPLGGNFLPFL